MPETAQPRAWIESGELGHSQGYAVRVRGDVPEGEGLELNDMLRQAFTVGHGVGFLQGVARTETPEEDDEVGTIDLDEDN